MRNLEYRIEPVLGGGFLTDEKGQPILPAGTNINAAHSVLGDNDIRRLTTKYTVYEDGIYPFQHVAITAVLCWNDVQEGFNLLPVQSSSLCVHTPRQHDIVPTGLDVTDAHVHDGCELNPAGCTEYQLLDVQELLPDEVDAYLTGRDMGVIKYLATRWHGLFATVGNNA